MALEFHKIKLSPFLKKEIGFCRPKLGWSEQKVTNSAQKD